MTGTLLSTFEVAARLNVDSSTVRLWCRQGRFPHAQQVGRDWVIPEDDLLKFTPPKMGRPRKVSKAKRRSL
ncbi:MAG: helix-turn-helix domain-containing protein [Pyrinomonadaceae bacterium]